MADSAGTLLHRWFDRLAETGRTAEVFLDALAEDLVWTATGTSPISGTYHGRDAYIDGIYRRLNERLASWPGRTLSASSPTASGHGGIQPDRRPGQERHRLQHALLLDHPCHK